MTNVTGHFRGADRFVWNGFRVQVVMPGTLLDARGFNVPSVYEEEMEPDTAWLGSRELGEDISDWEIQYGSREGWRQHGDALSDDASRISGAPER